MFIFFFPLCFPSSSVRDSFPLLAYALVSLSALNLVLSCFLFSLYIAQMPPYNIVDPTQWLNSRKQCIENIILCSDSVPLLAYRDFINAKCFNGSTCRKSYAPFWDCLSSLLKKISTVMKLLPAMEAISTELICKSCRMSFCTTQNWLCWHPL